MPTREDLYYLADLIAELKNQNTVLTKKVNTLTSMVKNGLNISEPIESDNSGWDFMAGDIPTQPTTKRGRKSKNEVMVWGA